MTAFALGFMLISIVSVTVLTVYCYARILKPGSPESGSEPADPGA